MDENKHFRCSFCGKTEQEVDKLLSGPGVYICNECIDMCNSILDGEFEHKGGFTAVSYTHLDVYKRQRMTRAVKCFTLV